METPVFLPGKSLGQGSLVGYSPWGHKELDTTKQQSAVDLLISVVNTSLLSGAFSSCGEPLPAAQRAGSGSTAEAPGRSCFAACGIFPDQGRPCVSCIGRQIPKHWITREVLPYVLFLFFCIIVSCEKLL